MMLFIGCKPDIKDLFDVYGAALNIITSNPLLKNMIETVVFGSRNCECYEMAGKSFNQENITKIFINEIVNINRDFYERYGLIFFDYENTIFFGFIVNYTLEGITTLNDLAKKYSHGNCSFLLYNKMLENKLIESSYRNLVMKISSNAKMLMIPSLNR